MDYAVIYYRWADYELVDHYTHIVKSHTLSDDEFVKLTLDTPRKGWEVVSIINCTTAKIVYEA